MNIVIVMYKMKRLTVTCCVLRYSYLLILLLVQLGGGMTEPPSNLPSNGKYDQIRNEVMQSHFRCSTVSTF